MSTAAELRFRVQAPNSTSRATLVIALDGSSETFIRPLSEDRWNQATFLKAPAGDAAGEDGWLTTLGDRRTRIRDEVSAADQVIMVAAAGGHAYAAAVIGRACSLKRVTTTALIIGAAEASDADVSKTLAQLRPWSLMVVIASSDDYVIDMMTALRV
jgi:predicted alpha/beta hydrolase family esterase